MNKFMWSAVICLGIALVLDYKYSNPLDIYFYLAPLGLYVFDEFIFPEKECIN